MLVKGASGILLTTQHVTMGCEYIETKDWDIKMANILWVTYWNAFIFLKEDVFILFNSFVP